MQYHPIYFCSSLPANALAFSTLNLRFIFYHFDPFYYFVNAFIATFCLYILWVYVVLFVVLFVCFVLFRFFSFRTCDFTITVCVHTILHHLLVPFLFFFIVFYFFFLLLLYCTNLGVMGVMPDNGIIVGDYLVASTSPTSD